MNRIGWIVRLVLAGILGLSCGPAELWAHEIPSDVTVRVFLHPSGDRLQGVLRAPLESMRDLPWPTFGPGYLDLQRSAPLLRDAAFLWLVGNLDIYAGADQLEDPRVLATRISLPNDDFFSSFDAARAALSGPPLDESTQIFWNQALIDVLFEYPIGSEEAEFAVRPQFARLGLRVLTVITFLAADGTERVFQLSGDPELLRLDPGRLQAALHFVRLGFFHILDGVDHLLFLLCLVIPLRRLRPLVWVVTSFTLAHSITLAAAALGLAPAGLWFPPLIETLIALSIVYMAIENVLGTGLERRWLITFGFGLVHGFGFSFALQETLQFAGRHLISALLGFNLGVELGQLLVIALLVPALQLLFRHGVAEKIGVIILSVLVGHTAWHWMIDRGSQLSQYSWPAFTPADLALALRWTLLAVVVAAAFWLVSLLRQVRAARNGPETETTSRIPPDTAG